ncbi:hypothetical protein YC2023_065987 [Brassica napus]
MLTLLVDCLGDFGPRGLSVQYIQDVRGCPPAHTGRPWVSVCVRQHTQDVRGCPSVHISARWYLDSACGPFPWTARVILAHVGCLFSAHKTSVVSASKHRTSVAVRVCPSVSVSKHIGRSWLSISTHISTLVLGLSTLTLPVDCSGDFGQRELSVQYTQDVCGCPPAHTGRPWLSVCVRVCSLAHTGRPWLSISTHISTLVLGLSTLALPVDCSGDFGPRGLSVQYTQDVRGCPSAHTGRPWVSVSTHRTSVGVRQHTQDVCGCPSVHISARWMSVSVRVCPCVSVSTHMTSWAVHQYKYQHVSPCTQHADPTRGLFGTSMAVRVCPCVSVSTHRTSVAVHQYIYQHAGPWTQHADPSRGLLGTSMAVRVCPCVSVSTHRTSVALHQYTYQHVGPTLALPVDCSGDFGPCGLSVPKHIGRSWLSISTHISTLVLGLSTLTLPVDCSGDFGPRELSDQYTQDVRGCPAAHTGRPWLSSTLVLGLSTLALLVDCSSDFGPPGLFVQYTQDIRGCPSAHIRRSWVSVSTHRTSVGVRQHTQDVCGCPCVSVCVRVCPSAHTRRLWLSVCVRVCPCVSVSTHSTSVAVHQYTYQHVGPWTQHADPSRGLFGTSMAVRVCPSAHKGRPWLSISTHIGALVLGLSTLAVPVDCSGDFGPRGLFVQYTQDVRGCPPAHKGRPSVTLALPVDCSSDFGPRGLSVVHTGRPWVSVSTHKTSVGVRQHPQDVRGCPSAHTGRLWLSVCVRVCLSAHTVRVWLSISTHISTLVLRLSTLAVPVDCSGDFGPRGLFVQYTQDVYGCPPAHTGRPSVTLTLPVDCLGDFGPRGLSVQYRQDVRGCPPANTGRPWLSVCVRQQTHRTSVAVHQYTYQHVGPWTQHADPSRGLFGTLVLGLSTLALPVDCSGDFGPRGLSLQYTQDIGGCPSAHTGRPWVSPITHRTSVAVRVCPCVSVSTHRTSVAVHQYTYQHVGPWIKHADPSRGLFETSVAVRVCPCVSVSSHRTSVAVHQYTYHHAGPWSQHAGPSRGLFGTSVAVRVCPSAHTGRPWLSIIHTGIPWVSAITHRMSVAVRVCPSAHTGIRGCPSVHISARCTHRTSVGVRQHTHDVCGCPPAHTGRPWLSVCVRVCLCVSVSTHRTSVAVHQYTYHHAGPWSQHAGPSRGLFGTSVCVSLSAHTGRLWLSISTHISTLVLGLSTLTLPVDCLGDFGPRGLSVQYRQDVRGCPPENTGRPWLSVCVRQQTHRMSVAVHLYTYQHVGPWTQHADPSRGMFGTLVLGLSTLALLVDCSGDFGPRGLSLQYTQDIGGCPSAHTGRPWVSAITHRTSVAVRVCPMLTLPVDCSSDFGKRGLSVQYTQDVCGCPPAHTGRPWLSVCVRVCLCVSISTHRTSVAVHQYTYHHAGPWSQHAGPSHGLFGTSVAVLVCPSAHTGRPWLSISTHISTLVLGHSTPTLPVDCLGDFGPRGLSVQYTQDFRGTHISTLVLGLSTLTLLVDCSGDFGPRGLSVQYTQNVRGCPPAHTGRPWLSVYVRVCPCVSVSTHRTSVADHQYTYQHAGPWTQHADPSRGLLGTSMAVRVCPCVSVSTHRTSVAVHQYTYQHVGPTLALPVDCSGDFGPCGLSVPKHIGPSWLSISTHISTLVLGLSTLTLPVDCSGDFGPRELSDQYTQDVRGCPAAHTGRPTLVLGLGTLALLVDCSSDFGPPGLSVQYIQDVRGCPPENTGRLWLSVCVRQQTHRTSVAVHQYTYQHVVHTGRLWVSTSTHMTSVAVRVCWCVSLAHTGRPWLSISTHISTLVLGLSTLALLVDCSGDFGPRGLSLQYTQDIGGCPSAHTGRPWVSAITHRTSVAVRVCPTLTLPVDCSSDFGKRGLSVQYTQDVCGCPPAHTGRPWLSVCVRVCLCVSVSTHRTSVAVHQYTYHHAGPWSQHAGPSRGLFGTHRTSVAVHQYTYQHVGPWTQHADPSRGLFGMSVAVRVCPCVSVSTHRRPWLSISTHISTLVLGFSTLTLPGDCSSDFGPRGLSVQYTQDVCGCPPAHTGRLWVSASTHRTSVAVRVCPCVSVCVSVSTHRTSVAVHQYTYHHAGPWSQHAGPSRGLFGTSVCVSPSAHIGRLWLSISIHISTLVLGLSTLTLPVDCLGDFGQRGLSVQYTQDVRGCPSAHTGRPTPTLPVDCSGDFGPRGLSVQYTQEFRGCPPSHTGCPLLSVCVLQHTQASVAVHQYTYQHVVHTGRLWVSASTHRTSVGVRQHTQDVCGCPPAHTGRPWLSVCVRVCLCVSVSTHRTSVAIHQYTYHHAGPWSQHAGPSRGLFGTSVCVSPSGHTGRLWLSISTHISTLVLGLSTLTLPVDCLGDFGPRGLSVQYIQDVRGCPPENTGRLWLSVCVRQQTHRTSVAVHQYTYQHVVHTGRLWVSTSTHMTSVAVRVCWCVSLAHTGRPWLSISTHISTLVLGLSTLALLVDCSGDFGPRGLSLQYTQDIGGCPSAHTGRPWVSAITHRTSVAVRVCPCVSVSTHRTSVAIHQYTYQHVVHTGRLWVSASTHRTSLSISTHITTLVLGVSTLALPVDCSGDFGPRGLSVQYTQDVRGCPSAHTGRLWLSLCVHQHTQDVRGCPSVHISARWSLDTARRPFPWTVWVILAHVGCLFSTHRTSVGVRHHTQDVCCCPCVSVSTHRRPWLSISTHISTLVLGFSTLTLPGDCSSDFGPRGLSVQYTQDVCGFPPAHTGRLWVSASTHRTSVAVRVCPCVSVCVSVSTHRTSVAVHQYTYHHAGPWSQHAGPSRGLFGTSVCVSPSAHIGLLWLSISIHISTLVLGLSTLTLPVDCLGDFGQRGLSVQYRQDVRGCPPANTGRPWLSVCVRQQTHRTSVAVHQYTYQHVGPWTQHADPSRGLFGTHRTSVGVRQHTQDVRGCPPSHTGRPLLSVCVRVCPSAHTGRLWLSISTHISMLVLGFSTLTLPVDCSSDFGPRGLSVQYTQDVCGYPPAHTGRPWLSVCARVCLCVSVSTHRTSVAVHQYTYHHAGPWSQHAGPSRGLFGTSVAVLVCPSAHTGRPWLSISTHISTLVLGHSTPTLPVDCLGDFGPRGLSVQYTQDFRGRSWLSISTHISTLVLGFSTLTLPVDCSSDFVPRGLSVQYTQDVCGCPPAHTGLLWVSASTHRTSVAVRVCLCVSVSTHRTSVAVHQYTYHHAGPWSQHAVPSRELFGTSICVSPSAHTGRLWLSISTHISTLVLGLSTLTLPVDCLGDFGPRGLSVQYRQDVCGCPPANTGRPWLSVCVRQQTHRSSVAVHQYTYQHVGPWTQHADPSRGLFGTSVAVHKYTYQHAGPWTQHAGPSRGLFGTSVGVRHHTQDVRCCPCVSVCVRVCLCVSVSTHRTSVAVHQYTYHHAGPWSQHAGPSRGLFGTSVAVLVCPSAHTGRPWLSISTHISTLVLGHSTPTLPVDCLGDFGPRGLSVQYTQDFRGRSWLSISTHISTLVLGFSTLTLPVDCSSDFVPRGLSVQYTQDVCGCPPAHTGLLWVSASTHRTSVAVRVCLCVSVSTHRTSVAVHHTHRTSVGVRQHTQDVHLCESVSTHRTSVAVHHTDRTSVGVRQQTQDVRGCLCVSVSKHIGRPWLSISTHISTLVLGLSTLTLPVDCSGRPWLSISTHISTLVLGLSTLALPVDCSVDFGPCGLSLQYTQDIGGCPSAHTGRPWVSAITHRTSVAVRVCPTLTLLVDCSSDFGPRGLSVQYTQDVCGCPPAHTGRPWLSVCVRVCLCVSVSTHRTSVAVHQYTYHHAGPWSQHAGPSRGLFGTHRTSVAVHQYTYQHVGPWTQHADPSRGLFGMSVAVRVCPCVSVSTHRRPWLSISTHISTLVLGFSTLTLPVDCSSDFVPRGLSVQYTQDVCGCPPAHTGRLWVSASTHRTSVAVRVCPCVSVCVRQHT